MSKIHVNGVDIHYEVTGQGDPLLFIHGLASSSRGWHMQVPVFSSYYRVVTFDIRGHGRSEKPLGPYGVEVFAADAIELVRSLGLSPAHVVGFSLGGMIAFQLAIDAPELVKSLVAVNCCPEGHMTTFSNGLACCKQITRVHLKGIKRKGQISVEQPLTVIDEQHVPRTVLEQLALHSKWPYVRTFVDLVGWSAVNRLDTISCPILVITSDQDYIPVSVKEWYISKIPGAKFAVIANSRHSTPKEQSCRFNAILIEFLSQQSEPKRSFNQRIQNREELTPFTSGVS